MAQAFGNCLFCVMSSSSSAQPQINFVDSERAIRLLVDKIATLPAEPPSLYCDLEGVNLCRFGTVSIFSLYVRPTQEVHLIDIYNLQARAFDTAGTGGVSLRSLLQSPAVPKVFFDIRNDSDALFAHYQVSVAGIRDLQLMELATRKRSKEFVSSLTKCIEYDSALAPALKSDWKRKKESAIKLYAPEQGGHYEVFNERPLPHELSQYCARDVSFLGNLFDIYDARLRERSMAFWSVEVRQATEDRIRESQSPGYVPNGQHKAKAPWNAAQIKEAIDAWNEIVLETGTDIF